MKKFLEEVVDSLYKRYGDKVSELTIVFPNRRASLFFSRDLSAVIDKAIWQPRYCSIDDLLRDYTGLEQAHELTLLTLLYEVYCERVTRDEPFDKFYSWGQMLLTDFDSIDKYLIDSEKLYTNMNDLQELDGLLGEDFEEKQIILDFWKAVKGNKDRGAESAHFATFMGIWSKLDDVYKEFKKRLKERGIGYSGMIYREAAAMFADAGNDNDTKKEEKYIFVGFNALNKCESLILDVLNRAGRAEFYWDTDAYYINDKRQEAGLFLRKNLSHYGGELSVPSNFRKPKQNVEVINAPNDVMQCKALRHKLLELHQAQGELDSETAVVLTDENLLPVVMYSIPSQVKDINITMGAPLSQSAPYVFFERLMTLQMTRSDQRYYYDSVLSVISHEYVRSQYPALVAKIENDITNGQLMYIDPENLNAEELNNLFPTDKLTTTGYLTYYARMIEHFAFRDQNSDPIAVDNNEYALALLENLNNMQSVITQAAIDVSPSILHSLLSKVNNATRIPFEGYPLKGLQVMGILESRCLDFRNVIILSMCDETFPGNKAAQSFIPPNLRKGFALPTQVEHGAMWAYYFYRLISRAQNVTMMYSSSREGNATGEKSRYIYQMEYESGHPVKQIGVDLHINIQKPNPKISVPKNVDALNILRQMKYSPSSINSYIDCPLKFYYNRLAKIKPATRPSGDIEANESGSILHRALELLYQKVAGDKLDKQLLQQIAQNEIDTIIDTAMSDVLKGRNQAAELTGRLSHLHKLIANQIRTIVNYDLTTDDLTAILNVEEPMDYKFQLDPKTSVTISGIIDRRDKMQSGTIRLVDYKSGSVQRKFKGVESLFTNTDPLDTQKYKQHNAAALQMLVYSLAHPNSIPGLLALKKMNDADNFSPLLEDETTGQIFDQSIPENVLHEVRERLKLLFDEILNPEIPFTQTEHYQTCKYCDYITICNRQHKELESSD